MRKQTDEQPKLDYEIVYVVIKGQKVKAKRYKYRPPEHEDDSGMVEALPADLRKRLGYAE